MTMIIEIGDGVSVGDAENQHRGYHRHPDPKITGKNRHEYPISEIGAQASLFPPRPALVARREPGEDAEHDATDNEPWQSMPKRQQELPARVTQKMPTHE